MGHVLGRIPDRSGGSPGVSADPKLAPHPWQALKVVPVCSATGRSSTLSACSSRTSDICSVTEAFVKRLSAALNKPNVHVRGYTKNWKKATLKRPSVNWSHGGVKMGLIKEEKCLKIAVISKKGSNM